MELYWPSSKVYFFGKFALFASNYEGKELRVESFDGFFTNQSVVDLINTLKNYQKDGYFKLGIVFSNKYIEQEIAKLKMSSMASISPGWKPYKTGKNYGLGIAYKPVKDKNPLNDKQLDFILESFSESELEQYIRITITEIGVEKFKSELTEYLKKYQSDLLTTGERQKPEKFGNQVIKLILAMKRHFAKEGYRPIISIMDIWSDCKQANFIHTFWELILTEELLRNNIKIININSGTDLVINQLRGAVLRTRLKGTPYAEFEIVDKKLRDIMTYSPKPKKPIVNTEYSLGKLIASTDGRIWLNGKDLNLRYQLRNLCRLLIMKSPNILLMDDILSRVDIIDPNREQKDPVKNVQKYVSELRKVLGNEFSIINDEQEGYKLLLSSYLKSE